MKQKFQYIIYIIALVIILIPIFLEQIGNPMSALIQTITLIVGLAVLFLGKLHVMNQKKRAGVRPATSDTLMLAVILFMAGYILYNYFV